MGTHSTVSGFLLDQFAARSAAGRAGIAVALAVLLGACVTNDGPPPVIGYNVLYSQADHMKRLVSAGNFDDAVALHGREGPYFKDNADKVAGLLDEAAKGFNAQWTQRISDASAACTAVAWPAPRERWSEIRVAVSGCTSVLRDYDASNGLTKGAREAPGIAELRLTADGLTQRIGADARGLMAAEDLAGGRNFISEYPIDLPLAEAFASRLARIFDPARPDEDRLFRVASAYAPQVKSDPAIRKVLVDAVDATLRTKARAGSLRDVAATYKQAARHGVAPERIPLTVAFYGVGGSASPFGATVVADLPMQWRVLSGLATVPDADFVVAVGPVSASVERKASNQARVPSRFISGYRSTPNPAYATAVGDFTRAQQQMASANAQQISAATDIRCNMYGCQPNYWAQLIAGIFVATASANLDTAQKKLTATPPTLQEAIFEDYGFDTASVMATKKAEFAAFIGKPRTGATEQFRQAVTKSQEFKVSWGVHAKDATLASAPFVLEKTVDDWEKQEVSTLLSALLEAAPERRGYLPWPQVATALERRQQPGSGPRAQASQAR